MPTATPDTKRRALGKGLESLLPSRPPAAPAVVPSVAAAAAEPTGKPLEIALDHIERNPWQTRTHFDESQLAELAASIMATGVVQPVIVRMLPPALSGGGGGQPTAPARFVHVADQAGDLRVEGQGERHA